jgi:hypothetical protein
MKFTLWAICPPLALFIGAALAGVPDPKNTGAGMLGLFALFWLWAAGSITVIYWIVRVVRRAFSDGSRTQQYPPPRY